MSDGSLDTTLFAVLGARLAEIRKRRGLTQQDLAARMGGRYEQSFISKVEAGSRSLRLDGVIQAAEALDVSIDYLVGLADEPQPLSPSAPEDRPAGDGRASMAVALSGEEIREIEAGVRVMNRFLRRVAGDPAQEGSPADREPPPSGEPVADVALVSGPEKAPADYLEAPYASEVRASAGGDEWVFEESADFRVRLRRSALPRWVSARDLVCIRVSGDSMEPGIRDGDLLAIDHSRIEPTDNRKFAVSTDDGLVVKRLLHTGAGWELASDNPRRASGNRPMRGDDRIVGQVAWNGPPLPGMVAPRDAID